MRAGLIASVTGHLALLLWGLIAFPDVDSFDAPQVESIPLDLISVSELTNVQKGEKDAEVREIPATKPTEKPVDAPQPVDKPAEKVSEKPLPPEPEPEPTPPPAPEPEPTPEPAPAPEAAPEPAPAPEPEPAPAAEPEPAPAETPAPAPQPDPAPQPEAPKVPTNAVPKTKPKPPVRQSEKPKEVVEPTERPDLLDKVEQALANSTTSQQPASAGSRTGVDHAGLTANEKDIIAQMIREKWNRMPDQYPDDLKVVLEFSLTPDGRLTGAPVVRNSHSDPRFQALASSAVRAVYRVEAEGGFSILPAEKYDGPNGWNTMRPTLSPNG